MAQVPEISNYKKNWTWVEKAYRVPVTLVRDDGVVYRTGQNYTFSPEPPPPLSTTSMDSTTFPGGRTSPQLRDMESMNGYDRSTENGYTRNHVKKTERHRPPPLLVLPGAVGNRRDYTPAVCSIEQLTPNSPLLTDSSTTSPPPRILSPPTMQQPIMSHVTNQLPSVTTCWNGSFSGVSMSHTYPGDCRILQTMHVPPQLVPIKQQEEEQQSLLLQQHQMRTGQVGNICIPPQLVPIPQQDPYSHHVVNGNAGTGVIPTVSLAALHQPIFSNNVHHAST